MLDVKALSNEATLKEAGYEHTLMHGSHAVVCAAALANLCIFEGEGLINNLSKMATHLLKGLQELQSHLTSGDVQGLSLIFRVEIVKDKGTKETFSESGQEIKTPCNGALSRNLSTHVASVISLSPPLCITEDTVDRIVKITDSVITDIEKKFGYA